MTTVDGASLEASQDFIDQAAAIQADSLATLSRVIRRGTDGVDTVIEAAATLVDLRNRLRSLTERLAAEAATLERKRTPLGDFTDEELLAAVRGAIESWSSDARKRWSDDPIHSIWSSSVADALAERHATKSEVSRVVHRLRKLEAAGLVERTNRSWEAVRWRVREEAII